MIGLKTHFIKCVFGFSIYDFTVVIVSMHDYFEMLQDW